MDIDRAESFPSLNDFKRTTEGEGEGVLAIPFRDLALHIVYQIINIKTVKIGDREAVILKLKNEQGDITDVWATTVLKNNLKEKSSVRQGKTLYIISKGRKDTKNRYYYDFSIIAK